MAQWHITPDPILKPCDGFWGLVFKEWEVIKQVAKGLHILTYFIQQIQTYPSSVQNLNRLTMTVDIDIYDGASQKVEIPEMPKDSPIKVKIRPCLLLMPGGNNEDETDGQEGNPTNARIPHSESGRKT